MLLSSTAEAMYWCGRYVERAQALSRVISSYVRLGMDLPGARPLDLKPLLALADRGDAGKTPTSNAGLLQALVFDESNPSSVLGALSAARENLRNARVVAPPELWHISNRIYARVCEARGRSEAVVLEALEETLAAGQRFDGERAGGMLRDAAWAFLSIGCELERADMLLRTLGVLVPLLRPEGWERAYDDVRWTGLLNALGLTSMYRRSHHVNAELTELLAQVLVSNDCPRSLAFCLEAIERQLRALPRAGRVRAAVSLIEREGAALGRASPHQLAPDLQRALPSLDELHTALQVCYFPKESEAARLPSQATVNPAVADPFSYLGREHQQAEGVLQLLDELSGRVGRGQAIDRADLAAVVGFLTDFGELDHHEKEEAILTPELVAAGFDCYDGPLAVMRREHRQEHYFVRVLSQLATEHEVWSAEATRSFVSVAREFCSFLRKHMDHEQHDLFEQASRTLAPEVKDRILAAFVAFDTDRRARYDSRPPLDDLLRKYRTPATRDGDAAGRASELP